MPTHRGIGATNYANPNALRAGPLQHSLTSFVNPLERGWSSLVHASSLNVPADQINSTAGEAEDVARSSRQSVKLSIRLRTSSRRTPPSGAPASGTRQLSIGSLSQLRRPGNVLPSGMA